MTTTTQTLADFLLARIAEDEAMAQRVLPYVEGNREIQVWLTRSETLDDGTERSVSETVAPYDPARVLAECEAKRRIVTRHSDCGTGYGHCDDGGHGWGVDPLGCADLADLASVFADHPDYDETWRP